MAHHIHRTPLAGRNFECFSEDPYLSAKLAVAYIVGLQSQGIGATVKHYVCNDSEFQRQSISSEVSERALREIYLPPFKAAVQEAGVWTLMAGYNKINGTFASENYDSLTNILKHEWGFDGLVMSDWFGTQSTIPSVNAGLDLEMPGPTQRRGEKLLNAFEKGEVSEETINDHVSRLLYTIAKVKAFDSHEEVPELSNDRPEHRVLAREAAAEGIVLLKNQGNVLPLQRDTLKSIAIIGPNAKVARIMGGGSAGVMPHYSVTPFDGVVNKVGSDVTVGYEPGCTYHKLLPLLDVNLLNLAKDGTVQGFNVEYFNNTELSGSPVSGTTNNRTEILWMGQTPTGINSWQFSARWSSTFHPKETGRYTFGLTSVGLSRLYIDGHEVIDNWSQQTLGEMYFGMGTVEVTSSIEMIAGRSYAMTLEYSKRDLNSLGAVRLGCLAPAPADTLERAATLAAASDVALIFAGLNNEWESEGFDRQDMELVGEQNALIEKIAAANKNTIVIINSGSPISMNWLDKVATVVQAWYPGQECGNAIADVLFGDTNPSGKLPQTFPVRLEDTPSYINYPGENGRVTYGEGLFVGYRYYEKKKIAPLFPFGFGLSYTTFNYDELRLSA